ncbi:MAG: Ig-like domain-containing protein [Spirochaetales bacterium]|nr:Ig-like domain-containing protein [Spirochaetales bacterium]
MFNYRNFKSLFLGYVLILIVILVCTSCMYFELGFNPDEHSGTQPDLSAPFINSVTPSDGSIFNGLLKKITIEFSEAVVYGDIVNNYSFRGAGVNTLSVDKIETDDDINFTIHLRGSAGNGVIIFEITSDIIDLSGNPLTGMRIFQYDCDGLKPYIDVLYPPTGNIIGNNFSEIEIIFSEEVKYAEDPACYMFSGAGAGSIDIKRITNTSGTTYLLELTGSIGNGEIFLSIDGITDRAGNSLSVILIQYTGDITTFAIQSVFPEEGKFLNRLSSSLRVTYNKEVTDADNPVYYSLTGNGLGTLAIDSINRITPEIVDIIFSGIPGNGTITFEVDNTLEDPAGNTLTGNRSFTYLSDSILPEIITATPADSAKLDDNFSQVVISFSEDMLDAENIAHYSISGPGVGTLSITSVVLTGQRLYHINLAGNAENGKVIFTIQLTDMAGNPLVYNTIEYLRDLEPPEISSSTPFDGSDVKPSDFLPSLIINLEFNEFIIRASAENRLNYSLSSPGLGTLHIVTVINNNAGDTKIIDLVIMGVPVVNEDIYLQVRNLVDLDGNILVNTTLTFHVVPD